MPFTLDIWRAETERVLEAFASDPDAFAARASAGRLYDSVQASPLPPLVAGYASDPAGAIQTLIAVAGGLGATLIANLAQQRYAAGDIVALAVQEAGQPGLASAYAEIATKLGVVAMAEHALARAGQLAALARLRAELGTRERAPFAGSNIRIEQSGGVNFGVGNSIGPIGTIVGGDQRLGGALADMGTPNPLGASDQHRQRLIAAHTQRLRLLELQLARAGHHTPPEVLIEIESLRATIDDLQRAQE